MLMGIGTTEMHVFMSYFLSSAKQQRTQIICSETLNMSEVVNQTPSARVCIILNVSIYAMYVCMYVCKTALEMMYFLALCHTIIMEILLLQGDY